MKTTLLRVVAVSLVAMGIVLMAAGGAKAASPEPDLIGGKLDVNVKTVTLVSSSTVPVGVAMTTDGPFSLKPATFDMKPGELVTMTVTGDPVGTVSARMTVLSSGAGDTASVTLQAGMPVAKPENPLLGGITKATPFLSVFLFLLAFVIIGWRRGWHHLRLTRPE